MQMPDDAEDDLQWMAPYVAGAFDWAGSLSASVQKDSSRKFGYGMAFQITMEKADKTAIGLIDEFCEMHGVTPNLNIKERDGRDSYRVNIGKREDIAAFLEAVFPYLVVRHEQAEILLDQVFPRLEDNQHHDREGFINIVRYLDQVNEAGFQRGQGHKKYDAETIAEELRDDF